MSLGDRIDNAIGIFAPVYAARRQAARFAVRMAKAAYYQGARSSRLTYNWSTGQESADTSIYGELQTLRDRSRDLNRNDAIASGITGTITVNTIETGLYPQAAPKVKALPISDDQVKSFQAQAEGSWQKWSPWADGARRLNFDEIQALAVRQILESGEFLAIRRALPLKKGRPYNLALDIMEPDRLATPGKGAGKADVRFGIKLNKRGMPTTYFIRKSHPGDTFRRKDGGTFDFTEVPATDTQGRPNVLHVFPVLRPGQTRGIPFFTPVIEKFKHLADYLEAELVAARVAACFSAFVKKNAPYSAAVGNAADTNADGQRLESLEPGVIEYLGPDEEVQFAKPDRPGTTFDQFVEKLLRMIGASLGLPYELVIKDFSKTNYSSARAALLQAYKVFKVWQKMIIDHLCQPMWELLMEEAWLRGELTAPGFEKFKWEYTRASWIPPGWQWVDPLKEAKAAETAVKMGFKTRADVCAEHGADWEEKAEQAAREKKKYEALGLPWEGVTKTPATPSGTDQVQP